MIKFRAFSTLELLLSMFVISLFSGIVTQTIIKSYSNNRLVETQAIVQTELNFAIDRITKVSRSTTEILEATPVNLKMRGYPNVNDTAPSEVNFYLSNGSLKYSVVPPTGSPPNYTYSYDDATYYTLVSKTSNDDSGNKLFNYYNENNLLLTTPIAISAIRVVEPTINALDINNILNNPIIVTTKISLRNFKTNL